MVEFARHTVIFSLQGGGGAQEFTFGGRDADVSFFNVTPRLSFLPFDPIGRGWLLGALETGLEGWVQSYLEPDDATAAGLKVVARYHLLGAAPLVPYVEGTFGAGGSSLEVLGHHSAFTFVLEVGGGLAYFVADRIALTAGYRFQHLSNGETSKPNRSYNANTGTAGVSFFFP
jgi:opacity protein-like surface antigen